MGESERNRQEATGQDPLARLRDLPPVGGQVPPFAHRAPIMRPVARLVARPILFLLKFLTTHQSTVNARLLDAAEGHRHAIDLLTERLGDLQADRDGLADRLDGRCERLESRAAAAEARLATLAKNTDDIEKLRNTIMTHSDLLDSTSRHLEGLRETTAASRAAATKRAEEIDGLLTEVLNAVTTRDAEIRQLRQLGVAHRREFEAFGARIGEVIACLDDLAGERAADREEVAQLAARSEEETERTRSRLEENLARVEASLRQVGERTDSTLGGLRELLQETRAELQSRAGALETELEKRTRRIDERIDFVRRETLFEVRYGEAPGLSPRDGQHRLRIAEARPIGDGRPPGGSRDDDKPPRLNVGCGALPLDGYLNVDRRDLPSVDILAEANNLPFDEHSVGEIYSAHLLEHFPQEQLRRDLLPYWCSLLRPGGILRAVVPDAEAMLQEHADGALPLEDLREVTFGSQDYDGDFHYNMFTPDSLAELLREAGFVDVHCPARGRRNGKCLEFEVSATKPEESGAAASAGRAAGPRPG